MTSLQLAILIGAIMFTRGLSRENALVLGVVLLVICGCVQLFGG